MIQHKTSNTSGKGNTCRYICIHHTATGYGTAAAVIKRFQSDLGSKSVSCHYLIDENGQIYKFNTNEDILWHAGSGNYNGVTDMNNHAIGIEVIGPLPGFTSQQKKSLKFLVQTLRTQKDIPMSNIIRHKDYTSRKVDIDDSLWNGQYKSREAYKTANFGEDEKGKIISQYMELGGKIYNMSSSAETKKRLNEMNNYFRDQGYDY